jgi:hypothetical protein
VTGADTGRVEQLFAAARTRQVPDGQVGEAHVEVASRREGLENSSGDAALSVVVFRHDQAAAGG